MSQRIPIIPHLSWNDTFYVEVLPPERRPFQPLLDDDSSHDRILDALDSATRWRTEPTTDGSNVTNILIDQTAYLANILGPKRQELYKVIPVTVIYCVIFITGIVGNICTCIVIARNKYMQTATNYYLFNLAIADLLVLILGLPQETYMFWSAYPWVFGETFCVIRTMAAETSTYASILTITAFTQNARLSKSCQNVVPRTTIWLSRLSQ